jgi:F0F1-type ATP synthase assembly protein I
VRKTVGPIAVIIQLGAVVVTTTLLPLIVGLWLDLQLRTTPWILLIGMLVGVVSSTVAVYRVITSLYKRSG